MVLGLLGGLFEKDIEIVAGSKYSYYTVNDLRINFGGYGTDIPYADCNNIPAAMKVVVPCDGVYTCNCGARTMDTSLYCRIRIYDASGTTVLQEGPETYQQYGDTTFSSIPTNFTLKKGQIIVGAVRSTSIQNIYGGYYMALNVTFDLSFK